MKIAVACAALMALFAVNQPNQAEFPWTDQFSKVRQIGVSSDPRLQEVSGLVTSVHNEGYFWTHNDSGDDPRLFLINQQGEIALTVRLENAENFDWEDIAFRRSSTGESTVFIGDIGDNNAVRDNITIYAIAEPVLADLAINEQAEIILQPQRMTLTYADGARDAETLLYDPLSEELIILSKRDPKARLYAFNFEAGGTQKLVSFGTLNVTQLTAGDVSAEGNVIFKNYNEVFYLPNEHKIPVKELLMGTEFQRVRYQAERQGEAIAWNRDCSGFYVLSEWNDNQPQPFFYYYD